MCPVRLDDSDLTQIAATVALLERSAATPAVHDDVVCNPAYWIARLDMLIASNRLAPDCEGLALSLRGRLALLVADATASHDAPPCGRSGEY